MKSTCTAGIFLLLTGLMLAAVADARTVTIYRIQLGAYPTQAEAEAKKVSAETEGFEPVYIVQKDGDFPWKVMTGDFPEYDGAKTKSDEYKQAGMNEGRGFVTQVEMAKEEAESKSLPIPDSALDTMKVQLAQEKTAAARAERESAAYRVQVGDACDLVSAQKLRAQLWFKGVSPVYIKQYGDVCAVMAGNYGKASDAILEASKLSTIAEDVSCSMSSSSTEDMLLDVTQPRGEQELLNATMRSYDIEDSQWVHVDSGMRFLNEFPDSIHAPHVHYKVGFAFDGIYWKHKADNDQNDNLRLLRAAAEHYEAALSTSSDSSLIGKAKYKLGVIHHRFSKYGLNLEELDKAVALISESKKETDLSPEGVLNGIAFFLERGRTSHWLLPEAEERLQDFIDTHPNASEYARAKAALMKVEARGFRLGEKNVPPEMLEELIAHYTAKESRKIVCAAQMTLADTFFRRNEYDRAIKEYQKLKDIYGPEDRLGWFYADQEADYGMGRCYVRKRDFATAQQLFLEAANHEPETPTNKVSLEYANWCAERVSTEGESR